MRTRSGPTQSRRASGEAAVPSLTQRQRLPPGNMMPELIASASPATTYVLLQRTLHPFLRSRLNMVFVDTLRHKSDQLLHHLKIPGPNPGRVPARDRQIFSMMLRREPVASNSWRGPACRGSVVHSS